MYSRSQKLNSSSVSTLDSALLSTVPPTLPYLLLILFDLHLLQYHLSRYNSTYPFDRFQGQPKYSTSH